jgi:hypothetical protein
MNQSSMLDALYNSPRRRIESSRAVLTTTQYTHLHLHYFEQYSLLHYYRPSYLNS